MLEGYLWRVVHVLAENGSMRRLGRHRGVYLLVVVDIRHVGWFLLDLTRLNIPVFAFVEVVQTFDVPDVLLLGHFFQSFIRNIVIHTFHLVIGQLLLQLHFVLLWLVGAESHRCFIEILHIFWRGGVGPQR